MSEVLLTTREVAELMGVGPTSVKRWADTGLLPCVRTAGGHRRFNRSEVDRFADHHQPIVAGQADLQGWERVLRQSPDVHQLQGRLLAMRASLGSWAQTADAFAPVLKHLHARGVQNQIESVEQCAAIEQLHRAVAQLASSIPLQAETHTCLLATACEDAHTLGLSFAELTARETGWSTRWIGPAARLVDLEAYVRAKDVDVVALSASEWAGDTAKLAEWLEQLGAACAERGAVLVFGGSAAWPTPPPRGARVSSFVEFASLLQKHEDLDTSVRPRTAVMARPTHRPA